MSNIDKIRQEIERLENEGAINKQKASENNDIESYVAWGQQEAIMGVLIRFIDSLQQDVPDKETILRICKLHKAWSIMAPWENVEDFVMTNWNSENIV